MADRDLINKPLPLVVPEERNIEKRGLSAPVLGKLGVQVRAREVGTEADAPKVTTEQAPPHSGPAVRGRGQPAVKGRSAQQPDLRNGQGQSGAAVDAPAPREAAFRAAYFNRDVGSTAAVNLRARPMAALRGEEGATDLKRVVLPPPQQALVPQPEQLGGAFARMVPEGQVSATGAPQLQDLIGSLSAWAQQPNMTYEQLQARMQQLEGMVELRKQALARMAQLSPAHLQRSCNLTQAIMVEGTDPLASPTLAEDAQALVEGSHQQAAGLHGRLAKVMGVKKT